MSEKLEQAKSEYIEKLKRVKLIEAGVGIDDVDRYIKYIDSTDAETIEQEAQAIVSDINQQDGFGDVYNQLLEESKNVWKPF